MARRGIGVATARVAAEAAVRADALVEERAGAARPHVDADRRRGRRRRRVSEAAADVGAARRQKFQTRLFMSMLEKEIRKFVGKLMALVFQSNPILFLCPTCGCCVSLDLGLTVGGVLGGALGAAIGAELGGGSAGAPPLGATAQTRTVGQSSASASPSTSAPTELNSGKY